MTTNVDASTLVPASTVERILFDRLDAETLSHLAWLKRQSAPRQTVRRNLTPDGVAALAGILERGSVPTIGFFRRHCA